MKKAFLFLSAILITMLFTGCKPDNYLYGLKFYEGRLGKSSSYHVISFDDKDSCTISYYGIGGKFDSKEREAYSIKNKETFYIGRKKLSSSLYEYNKNNNTIKRMFDETMYYPEPHIQLKDW